MRKTFHIYSVAVYSCLALLAVIMLSIQSHHTNAFQSSTIVRSWIVIVFMYMTFLGMATFGSLMSIHKRLSALENRNTKDIEPQ